jgi:7-carboxy-7-deazaguanine synthase
VSDTVLFLSEIFESIQGETSLTGVMSSFLRLSGCNLRCSFCDSPYSFEKGIPYTFEDLHTILQKFRWKHVCVTGGEPLLQQPTIPFLSTLVHKGYIVSLETNGALSIQDVPEGIITILDVKCPGSGMCHKNMIENLKFLRSYDQIKFVISDKNDYEWAKEYIEKYNLIHHTLLFSPAWGLLSPQDLISWIKSDALPVRLNVQLHKYIFGPHMRGV